MFDHIFEFMTKVISVASFITATTPTPNPKSVIGKIYKIIEYFALVNHKVKETVESSQK